MAARTTLLRALAPFAVVARAGLHALRLLMTYPAVFTFVCIHRAVLHAMLRCLDALGSTFPNDASLRRYAPPTIACVLSVFVLTVHWHVLAKTCPPGAGHSWETVVSLFIFTATMSYDPALGIATLPFSTLARLYVAHKHDARRAEYEYQTVNWELYGALWRILAVRLVPPWAVRGGWYMLAAYAGQRMLS